MIRRLLIAFAAALALAGCKAEVADNSAGTASPILYRIDDSEGALRGWLFGTIHALPDGTEWRTETLDEAVEQADLLVVEIAALDDSAALFQTFSDLATSPGQPDIGMRVPETARPALFDLIRRAEYRPQDFHAVETWAAALLLAQSGERGDSKNGADRALLDDFDGREIREFEGAARQLAIFDRLPDKEQQDLLLAVVAEDGDRAEDPDRLRKAWLAGDARTLEDATTQGIMADPELRAALLVERNLAWSEQLVRILGEGRKPLVAVGAAHLVGPDGLAALLEKRGFSLERIQ